MRRAIFVAASARGGALNDSHSRWRDVRLVVDGSAAFSGGFAGAGCGAYQHIGTSQAIGLASFDDCKKLVAQLGGLALHTSAGAPPAR